MQRWDTVSMDRNVNSVSWEYFLIHNKSRCKYMQIRGCIVDCRVHAAVCELLKQLVALNLPISCENCTWFFCFVLVFLSVRDDSIKWANVASEKTVLISQQTERRICILKKKQLVLWLSSCVHPGDQYRPFNLWESRWRQFHRLFLINTTHKCIE